MRLVYSSFSYSRVILNCESFSLCSKSYVRYHIDGFRFDLMGIHDITTMNSIRAMLDKIDPSILLFGEGWDLYTPLSENMVANHNNAVLMPRVGQFNDGLREALK